MLSKEAVERIITENEFREYEMDCVPFGSNKYAYIYEDHSVDFNSHGLESFKFDSLENFVQFYYGSDIENNLDIPHYYSTVVGERQFKHDDESQDIVFEEGVICIPKEGLDDCEDGGIAWSNPQPRGENLDMLNSKASAICSYFL